MNKQQIKDRILKQRGITRTLPTKGTGGSLIPTNIPITGNRKTPLMRMLELKYGKGRTIEEMLLSGSLSEIRRLLGKEVDKTTLSKWIKKFKLRFSETNLPTCDYCHHYAPKCELGSCVLLYKLEEYELMELKRRELLNG